MKIEKTIYIIGAIAVAIIIAIAAINSLEDLSDTHKLSKEIRSLQDKYNGITSIHVDCDRQLEEINITIDKKSVTPQEACSIILALSDSLRENLNLDIKHIVEKYNFNNLYVIVNIRIRNLHIVYQFNSSLYKVKINSNGKKEYLPDNYRTWWGTHGDKTLTPNEIKRQAENFGAER